jgi:hypothetical protein
VKQGDEFRASMHELKQAKAGRMKQLKQIEAAKAKNPELKQTLPLA